MHRKSFSYLSYHVLSIIMRPLYAFLAPKYYSLSVFLKHKCGVVETVKTTVACNHCFISQTGRLYGIYKHDL